MVMVMAMAMVVSGILQIRFFSLFNIFSHQHLMLENTSPPFFFLPSLFHDPLDSLLRTIARPLAQSSISILYQSAAADDYFFVKEEEYERVLRIGEERGCEFWQGFFLRDFCYML